MVLGKRAHDHRYKGSWRHMSILHACRHVYTNTFTPYMQWAKEKKKKTTSTTKRTKPRREEQQANQITTRPSRTNGTRKAGKRAESTTTRRARARADAS